MNAKAKIQQSEDAPLLVRLEPTEPLSPVEKENLCRFENTIARGLHTFFDVGEALEAIRQGKLYRAGYGTFEQYCRERWDFSRMHAYRLINAAEICRLLPDDTIPKPEAEAQVRPLTSVPKEKVPAVWREAAKRAGSGRITARIVEFAAANVSARSKEAKEHKQRRRESYWQSLVNGMIDTMRAAVDEERIGDVQFQLERIRLIVEEVALAGVRTSQSDAGGFLKLR